MEVAHLNARIDAQVKRKGDATLARFGVSATEAIRALWKSLAETETLPDFLREQDAMQGAQPSGAAVTTDAAEGAGMALALARERGLACAASGESYDALRELAFEELVAEGVYRV